MADKKGILGTSLDFAAESKFAISMSGNSDFNYKKSKQLEAIKGEFTKTNEL